MTSIDFIKSNPELLKKAQECSSKEEFMSLAKLNNINFEDISLEAAYDFLNKATDELEEDSLKSIAGGEGKFTNLKRLDTPEEIAAYKNLGYKVIKDLTTGHNFAVMN